MRSTPLFLFLTWFLFIGLYSVGQVAPFQKQTLLTGIDPPSSGVFLPDGRMLITQLHGDVLITSPIAQLPITTSIYLSITNVDFSAEHGLIEIELDPNFATNNYVYLYYSTLQNKVRLSRFVHNGNSASLASETIIFESFTPYTGCCHTGGAIVFAPDGTLFLAVGDDFNPQLAQTMNNCYGKIHRINPNGSVPVDNPFYDSTPGMFNASGVLKTIYAYGLRNPFRGGIDSDHDRLLMGVVGGNDHTVAWEDLHEIKAGANYGWPNCGDAGRDPDGSCNDPQYEDALFSYPHNGTGASITGGFVYHGSMFPSSWTGRYFYADYARWSIRYLTFDSIGDVLSDEPFMDVNTIGGEPAKSVVKLIPGPDGALYYISIFDDFVNYKGSLNRVVYLNDLPPICQSVSVTPSSGPGPTLSVQCNAVATDPEGLPVSYEWYFGDGSPSVNMASTTHVYSNPGVYNAEVIVSDTTSSVSCGVIPVTIGSPPTVSIISPVNGSLFQAASTVTFQASFADDGPISEADLDWNLVFNHDAHIHPAASGSGVSNFDYNVPVIGHEFSGNTWYTITVTITDSDGLMASHSIEIYPQKVEITIDSDPSGLEVIVGGLPQITPFTIDHAVNSEVILSIGNSEQCLDETGYQFQSWSNGGAPTQFYYVPNVNDTVSANFTAQGPCNFCGTAMLFDGVNDMISFPSLTLLSDLTMEFWVRPESFMTASDVLIGNSTDFAVDLDGGKVRVLKGANVLSGSLPLQTGAWQHIALTRTNGLWSILVNGVVDGGSTGSGVAGAISVSQLGRAFAPAAFHGAIDEVRIWNVARTPAQVMQYSGQEMPPNTNGMLAYWRMDQQQGIQSIQDLSGNGNEAVLGASNIMGTDDPVPVTTSGPMALNCQRSITMNVHAWLQGAFDHSSMLMSDALRDQGFLPLIEPYTALSMVLLGFGGESVLPAVLNATGPNAIVDWVLMELRDMNDPSLILATYPLLIQRDGDIVRTNGTSLPSITIDRPAYYVAIRHRNHLGAMTAVPVSFNMPTVQVLFTDPSLALYGTEPVNTVLGNLLLWAGSVNLDHMIKYAGPNNDRDLVLVRIGGSVPTNVVLGYFSEDVTMDGVVKYTGADNDRDTILTNLGGNRPTSIRNEQLP